VVESNQKPETRNQKSCRVAIWFLVSGFWFLHCATQPPAPQSPDWNTIPQGVLETFCLRLKAEGVAEGAPVAIVSTTQPIASPATIAALAGPAPKKANMQVAADALKSAQRRMPLTLTESRCQWIAIDSAKAYRRADQMIVELSAPAANPFRKGQAGLFVRVSLAGEHGQWYWISLIPRAGGWVVGNIEALPAI
jgi:hypothetical protein